MVTVLQKRRGGEETKSETGTRRDIGEERWVCNRMREERKGEISRFNKV